MFRRILTTLLILAMILSILPVSAYGRPAQEALQEPQSAEEPAQESSTENISPFSPEERTDTNPRTYEGYLLPEPESGTSPKATKMAGETQGTCGENLQWTFTEETGELIISGTGAIQDYSSTGVPWYSFRAKIKSLMVEEGVTVLGQYAFYNCTMLTTVSLPSGLSRIGYQTFASCGSLTEIAFPEGLESIGYGAFNVADLRSIHLPASLKTLGDLAFYGCENLNGISVAEGNETFYTEDGVLYNRVKKELVLCPADRTEHLVIPSDIVKLSESGIAHCIKLEGITIPDNMTWATNAFTFCKGFLNVYTTDTNPKYDSVDGVLYSRDHLTLVLFPAGRSGSYEVIDGTVTIDYAAFCRMENEIDITLPDTVEVIDGSAFSYSIGLRNLKLSANLREIYAHAFNGCKNMTDVALPETLTLLGYGSFENCRAITAISVPSQITNIANDTFRGCSALKTVELKGPVATIYNYSFYNCTALETINFPESLELIGSNAFYMCKKLKAVDLPAGLTTLGSYAFNYCSSISKVVIPSGLEVISSGAFSGCSSLQEVVIAPGPNTIGNSAFYNTAITQIIIPDTITSLGSSAFSLCRKLESVHFCGDAPTITDTTFKNSTATLVLYYTLEAEGFTSPTWNGLATDVWVYHIIDNSADCINDGTETLQCTSHCNMTVTWPVKAYGHQYGEWIPVQAPTETQSGYWNRICSRCNHVYVEEIPTLSATEQVPMTGNNLGMQNYTTYGTTVKSYLLENADGTLTRVEYADNTITLEQYDKDFAFLSRRALPMELPIFGGFYEGKDYYFLVYGQENPQEDESAEVVRVVRYTKEWLRKGQSSLCGANTTIPFDAGSLRMTQYGDMLYVHTCHEMYKSSDGNNHQANMIFSVHIPNMEITDQYTEVMNVSYGYVSHSFNQFIITDGDRLITLNHGDAYPRGAVLIQYPHPAGEKEFTGQCLNTSVMNFYGGTGTNATGVSLGALECSDSAYLIAGNSIYHDGSVSLGGQRNIFIGAVPRGGIGEDSRSVKWITTYESNAKVKVSTPHLVQIDQNRFLLLWTENDALRYVFVDGEGNMTSKIYESYLPLSDCKPIVYNRKVCWYVTQNSNPLFCTIDLDAPESATCSGMPITVTLSPEGGTLDNSTVIVSFGQPYGELPTPKRKSAFQFLGWYTRAGSSGQKVTAETVVSSMSDHTLYAHWERLSHSCEHEVTEIIPANCTSGEIKVYTCIYCDSRYRLISHEVSHTWNEGTVIKEPTCNTTGQKIFVCILCKAEKTETIPTTAHSYTETVTAPTCQEKGYTTYTCHCGDSYRGNYTYALGHDWDEGILTVEPTCYEPGEKLLSCRRCTATKTLYVPATGHNYVGTVTDPTCEEYGYTTYVCHCGSEYRSDYTYPLGHDWDKEGTVTNPPTCTDQGKKVFYCSRCTATKQENVPATGHSYTATVVAPTCTEEGYTHYICHCNKADYLDDFVPATGHSYTETVVEPTCLEGGYTLFTCHCGHSYQGSDTQALGHRWDSETLVLEPGCETPGEVLLYCGRCTVEEPRSIAPLGHTWHESTVVKEPTETEDGLRVFTCRDCDKTREQIIPATGEHPCEGGDDCPSARFTDIAGPTDWSHAGIDFVVKHGLFSGTGQSTFSPQNEMTRAMLVTVLWRYVGSPVVGSNAFTDVPEGTWYTEAVAWATHTGVVNGVGKGRFDPNGNITREQIATILYRFSSSEKADSYEGSDLSKFPDADQISSYAKIPMEWAVEAGLISGIQNGDTVYLRPAGNATRAQVATILMRLIRSLPA